jgi:hypothetical protein
MSSKPSEKKVIKTTTSQLLSFFWPLSSENETERDNAINNILSILIKQQSLFVENNNQDLPISQELTSYLEKIYLTIRRNPLHCKYLDYTLSRLIRGLPSPSPYTRRGYSLALLSVYILDFLFNNFIELYYCHYSFRFLSDLKILF